MHELSIANSIVEIATRACDRMRVQEQINIDHTADRCVVMRPQKRVGIQF